MTIRGSELILARRRLGALATLIGVTPQGDRYRPAWFTTGKLCEALDLQIAHMEGKSYGIRRIMVKLPTQMGKSYTAEELFSAAIAGRRPRSRIINLGYGSEFMDERLPNVKALSQTEGYRAAFPHVRLGKPDSKTKGVDNTKRLDINEYQRGEWRRTGGYILARSVRGAVSGKSMDAGILGDPYKDWPDALSAATNRQLRSFYTGVLAKRQQSRRTIMTVAFTPWTPTDIGNFILDQWEKEKAPYLVLSFPMFQRPDSSRELDRWNDSPAMRAGLAKYLRVDTQALEQVVAEHGLRPYDHRPDDYPLLPFMDRDEEFYQEIRRSNEGLRDWMALCQMDPEAAAFERFPRSAWRTFDPKTLTPNLVIFSCDPNAKATDDGSFAVVGVYQIEPVQTDSKGKLADPDKRLLPITYQEKTKDTSLHIVREGVPALPFKLYRLDEARDRPDYTDLLGMISRTFERWPEGRWLVLEDKAAGQALAGDERFQELCRQHNITVIMVNPKGDKDTRTARAQPAVRNGYCLIPAIGHDRITTHWLHDDPERLDSGEGLGWLREMAERREYDDRPDEFSQLVDVLLDPESRHHFSSWDFLSQFG